MSSEIYLQISSKMVIYCLVETLNHVHNILRLSMPEQIFFTLKFSYVVLYKRLDWLYFFIYTEKLREVQYRSKHAMFKYAMYSI